MRFGPESLGMLVRPRILASGKVLALNTKEQPPYSLVSLRPNAHSQNPYLEPERLFGKSLSSLFFGLLLGDTTKPYSKPYTAKVVSYMVKVGSNHVLVDSNNIHETLTRVRNRYGKRTNFKILMVGVKFYQSFRDNSGFLEPMDPLSIKTKDGSETIWFYKPWELVPMTEIIKYESVTCGDLVLFQKTNGLVIRKKSLNKPKFYLTSSWSCYSITLLNHAGDGYTRFLPDRRFTIRRKEDSEDG